jgi:hypothetical protein
MALWGLARAVMPIQFTAAVELRRAVEKIRVDAPPLPNDFYDEYAWYVADAAKQSGATGSALKDAVRNLLPLDTIIIVALLDGETHPLLPEDGYQAKLLRKHRLIA